LRTAWEKWKLEHYGAHYAIGSTAMARLTFNTAASREYFESERLNWLRLRIERGVVTLRPAANSRGDDTVIRIERRPRGIVAEIDDERFSKRLMQRLVRAGLTEDQPYFLLAPASYGWIGIDHLPGMKPPQRQAIMVVSNFDETETTVQVVTRPAADVFDFSRWQRFLRGVNAGRAVDALGWDEIEQMIREAAFLIGRPRRGRESRARVSATKLMNAVKRRAPTLVEWEEQHPELGRQVSNLLVDVGIALPEPEADVIPIRGRRRTEKPQPVVTEEEVEQALESVSVFDTVVPEAEPEPEDLPPPPRKASRRRPRRSVQEPVEVVEVVEVVETVEVELSDEVVDEVVEPPPDEPPDEVVEPPPVAEEDSASNDTQEASEETTVQPTDEDHLTKWREMFGEDAPPPTDDQPEEFDQDDVMSDETQDEPEEPQSSEESESEFDEPPDQTTHQQTDDADPKPDEGEDDQPEVPHDRHHIDTE
jgi:hypothetical protein